MNNARLIDEHAAGEISKAVNGIEALLRQLHTTAEDHGALYGIMSNIAIIRTALDQNPGVSSN